MVRLVFRPYTQVRRSICTSESLRTSTRVSPGFILPRHSSPSFGSQRARSSSTTATWAYDGPAMRPARDLRRGWRDLANTQPNTVTCFHFASGFQFLSQRLARMLSSLVRVSRRVRWAAVYSPPNLQCATLKAPASPSNRERAEQARHPRTSDRSTRAQRKRWHTLTWTV